MQKVDIGVLDYFGKDKAQGKQSIESLTTGEIREMFELVWIQGETGNSPEFR